MIEIVIKKGVSRYENETWHDISGQRLAVIEVDRLAAANLSHMKLSTADLSHMALTGTDFSYSDLTSADLSHSNLSRANLSHCTLHTVNFVGANLTGACLANAIMHGAKLYGADLTSADLTGVRLRYARYDVHTKWPADFDVEETEAKLVIKGSADRDIDYARRLMSTKTQIRRMQPQPQAE